MIPDDELQLSYHINQLSQATTNENDHPSQLFNIDSKYYDIDDIHCNLPKNTNYKFTALHLNIHSLPAKFDQLNTLLSRLRQSNIQLHFILLCETFLNDKNASLFQIPGYNFIYKNRQNSIRGGIAMYIREDITFKIRDDIAIHVENEFESLIIEINTPNKKTIIGEIYRVPNTSENISIQRFESLISK
jgi:hypothetical protein